MLRFSPLVLLAAGTGVLAATMAVAGSGAYRHRYLIERSFAPGALDGLDAATKRKVNAANASLGVEWIRSYANADKTRTFCVYEGPSEAAVREAAKLNALPVDRVTEVPVDLEPGPSPQPEGARRAHRYLVERSFPAGALDGLDAAGKAKVNANNDSLGVRWINSYANAEKTRTFCVYEGPSEQAVRDAAALNDIPVDAVVEIPVDLEPR